MTDQPPSSRAPRQHAERSDAAAPCDACQFQRMH